MKEGMQIALSYSVFLDPLRKHQASDANHHSSDNCNHLLDLLSL